MTLRFLRVSPIRGACVGASLLAAVESQACINAAHDRTPRTGDGPQPVLAVKMQDLIPFLSPPDDTWPAVKFGKAAPRDFAQEARRYAALLAYIREYEAHAQAKSFAETINYAASLMHVDRAEQAVQALVALEARHPGAYETATNLGTAYELTGKLEDAAVWIGKGIERNPASHDGTEWLHLAILRAKLKLRDDPAWLATHSVLEGEGGRTSAEIVRAIDRQLRERLQFVKPQDATVCDLFYQAAVRVEGERAIERRTYYLRESLRFGDWRKADVEKRLKS
jgi:hypothetical protein